MKAALLLSVEIVYLTFSFKPAYPELRNQVHLCLTDRRGGRALESKQPVRHFLILPCALLESDLHSKPRTNPNLSTTCSRLERESTCDAAVCVVHQW